MFKRRQRFDAEVAEETIELVRSAIETVHEVQEVAHEAHEVTERAIVVVDEALTLAMERRAYASGVVALAGAIAERAGVEAHTIAMSGEELQAFAEAFPQWTVSTGFTEGHAVKTYSRVISAEELPVERRRGGEKERETYLSLADYEHSDLGLAQIFDTFGFTGDYWNGEFYKISISSMEQGPITYDDFARVIDAECYLVAEGYVLPVESEITT